MRELFKVEDPKAATVSSAVLHGILQSPASMFEYKLAIERALTYEKCLLELEGMAKRACQYDKALANVGALFSQQVAGRVSTEVDPQVAYDTQGIVTRAQHLMTLYDELGIKRDRVIVRIPATWEGIQAAGQLEKQGINTHLILVYRCVQHHVITRVSPNNM